MVVGDLVVPGEWADTPRLPHGTLLADTRDPRHPAHHRIEGNLLVSTNNGFVVKGRSMEHTDLGVPVGTQCLWCHSARLATPEEIAQAHLETGQAGGL